MSRLSRFFLLTSHRVHPSPRASKPREKCLKPGKPPAGDHYHYWQLTPGPWWHLTLTRGCDRGRGQGEEGPGQSSASCSIRKKLSTSNIIHLSWCVFVLIPALNADTFLKAPTQCRAPVCVTCVPRWARVPFSDSMSSECCRPGRGELV